MTINKNTVHSGDRITYIPSGQGAEAHGTVEFAISDGVWVIEDGKGGLRYKIAWHRITGHIPKRTEP